MIKVAILGYGVVGSGVAEVLRNNAEEIATNAGKKIIVEKILDIRDFKASPDAELLTKNADDVFKNEDISIVVETIGGAKIAYDYTKRALMAGKSVVTSNKELVATHGPELIKLAKDNGVSYMFEASVGGGIPIIRPIQQCLAANVISGILGILNGTTNYILSKMKLEGKDFSVALEEAQVNGYAEADPSADVEGYDTCRKIAILSSLAYGEFVDSNKISTTGITQISPTDMLYADSLGCKIKLLGMSRRLKEGIYARVSPVMLPVNHALGNVEDVFNGIVVRGNALGDAMFYGRGAGKLPTASAVVADVIDIAKKADNIHLNEWKIPEENNVVDINEYDSAWFVRVDIGAQDKESVINHVKNTLPVDEILEIDGLEGEIGFTTEKMNEGKILKLIDDLAESAEINKVLSRIRLYK